MLDAFRIRSYKPILDIQKIELIMTRSPRQLAQQKIQQRKQQEQLFGDLLTVIDTLDRATDHWQQAQSTTQMKTSEPDTSSSPSPHPSQSSWSQRLKQWLHRITADHENTTESAPPSNHQDAETLIETITSALDGNQMIRTSLLEILAKHQVAPISAQGQPFNPETMKALGQQPDDNVPPNTVIQEVVRGYFWKDKVLREAQVIVSQPRTRENN